MRVSLLPIAHLLRSRLARALPLRRLAPLDPTHVATRSWQLAPGVEEVTPPAVFLPGQLERITGWAFHDAHPGREMTGGLRVMHAPTRAHLLEHVWLVDGVLYKGSACAHLSPRTGRLPRLHVQAELERAAIYCTPAGNRWFGQWLMDDCPMYPLARAEGTPVTTMLQPSAHARAYEAWFGMSPTRLRSAYLQRVVLFLDVGQNRDKHRRFRAMSDALLSHVEVADHPGVFLLRGQAGERRVLRGELELAERLHARHGLRILDPLRADVPTIVRTCAGSRVVVGVEGSAIMHGLLALSPGAAVLALEPPGRFCGIYKHLTDRDGQRFAFVVGRPEGEDFSVDPEEVEKTLDLL
jgi:Glycosyltransferase 61